MKITLKPTFLTVDEVSELSDGKAEILNEMVTETAVFGDDKKEVHRCNLMLADGHRETIWTANEQSLANLVKAWKDESIKWIGKMIDLKIEKSAQGRKMIVAYPV